MNVFKRVAFALRHNIAEEFVVVPFGEKMMTCRFIKYKDAVAYTKECHRKEPMFERPCVMKVLL